MAAIEVALEDDLFFADLNRQISLLIDEDEDIDDYPVSHFPSIIYPQEFSRTMIHHQPTIIPSQYLCQENYRREMSKGTGVFIPQSSQPRRKYKQGKRSTTQSYYSAKSNNKQLVNSKGRATNAVNLSPSYTTSMINRY